MNWLSPLMFGLSALLQVYMLLLLVRILLTWVSMDHGHPALRILSAVADPYLGWFRRFRFLAFGGLDFSPLAALLVINFFASLTRMVGQYGQISLGIILAILVQLVWGVVGFFFLLLGIAALVRYLALLFRWGGPGSWVYLDQFVQPAASLLSRRLRPGTLPSYPTSLLMLILGCLAVWGLGGLAIDLLSRLLLSLPF